MIEGVDAVPSFVDGFWDRTTLALIALDGESDTIRAINSAGLQLVGQTEQDLVGRHWSSLGPQLPIDAHEAYLRAMRQQSWPITSSLQLEDPDGRVRSVMLIEAGVLEAAERTYKIYLLRDLAPIDRQQHFAHTLQWALEAFIRAAQAPTESDSYLQMSQMVCDGITSQSRYLLAWIGEAGEGPEAPVRVLASAGQPAEDLATLQISWSAELKTGWGVAGQAIRTGKTQKIDNVLASSNFQPWRTWAMEFGYHSVLGVPLTGADGWRGVLMVYAAQADAFEPLAMDIFNHLGQIIGHGMRRLHEREQLELERLHRIHAQEQLTEAFSAIVSALVRAVESRDPFTAGHENRVALLAAAIARQLGWSERRQTAVRMAAMVHDIGKISVPIEILLKPGPLDAAERSVINQHPEIGFNILKDIPFDWPLAEIVRQHHEKLDGSGYPHGLSGDAILPEARVLTVADMLEAMAWDRPYRRAMDLEVALGLLEAEAGKQLDAQAVEACAALCRLHGLSLLR